MNGRRPNRRPFSLPREGRLASPPPCPLPSSSSRTTITESRSNLIFLQGGDRRKNIKVLNERGAYFVRDPETSGGVLHDNGRVAVFDDRCTDNLEILVLENDLLIILLLPQRERRGLDRGLVPSNGRRGREEKRRRREKKEDNSYNSAIIGLTLELF